jgi:integrase
MYYKLEGKQREKNTGTTNRVEARLIRQRWIEDLHSGKKISEPRGATVSDFIDRYIAEVARFQKSWDSKKSMLKLFKGMFGSRKVSSLRHADVELMVQDLKLKPYYRHKKPLFRSVATVNRYIALFHTLASQAERWRLIRLEQVRDIHSVRLAKEENERMRRLTDEESLTLLESCNGRLYPIVFLALFTGLRKSEILTLTWKQVDLQTGFIRLQKTKAGKPRNVPISEPVRELLTSLPRNLKGNFLFTGRHNKGPRTTISNEFPRACKRAGLNDVRFHDLRHTFASNCAMSGATEHELMTLLGHSSTRMVRRYTHLSDEHLQSRVNKMSSRLTKGWLKVG